MLLSSLFYGSTGLHRVLRAVAKRLPMVRGLALGLYRLRQRMMSLQRRRQEWCRVHQPYELSFHRQPNYRWDEQAFVGDWQEVFGRFMELAPDAFGPDDVILDLGCGSRPAFDYFAASPCQKYYLDPLLKQYLHIPQVARYWSDKDREALLAAPAEEFIPWLRGRCRFVNCWNVLEHAYDWRQILRNIASYTFPSSQVCLATDFTPHGAGHPGIDDRRYFHALITKFFRVEKELRGYMGHEIALKLVRNEAAASS